MTIRRKIGDRVWVVPGAGFGSAGEWAKIPDTPCNAQSEPCLRGCGDEECREWCDVHAESGKSLYHVSECEMLDAPQEEPPGIS